jgi:hypothetical protein
LDTGSRPGRGATSGMVFAQARVSSLSPPFVGVRRILSAPLIEDCKAEMKHCLDRAVRMPQDRANEAFGSARTDPDSHTTVVHIPDIPFILLSQLPRGGRGDLEIDSPFTIIESVSGRLRTSESSSHLPSGRPNPLSAHTPIRCGRASASASIICSTHSERQKTICVTVIDS